MRTSQSTPNRGDYLAQISRTSSTTASTSTRGRNTVCGKRRSKIASQKASSGTQRCEHSSKVVATMRPAEDQVCPPVCRRCQAWATCRIRKRVSAVFARLRKARSNVNPVAQQMMAAGYDPMDQNAFMTFMMNQGYGPPGGPGSGFGGGGQNSTSPRPQGGQGFQPPQGPGGGDQGGFGGNMEGYSAQQIAIMQGQQQGGQGGRGRGRGRGWR
jgi:hypothetical protein